MFGTEISRLKVALGLRKVSVIIISVGRLYLAFSFTGAKATVCNLRDIAERQVEFNVGSCPRNVFVQLQRK